MNRTFWPLVALGLLLWTGCATPVEVVPVRSAPVRPSPHLTVDTTAVVPTVSPYEGIATGRFDGGKMWTFDHPPLAYFREQYGFEPDSSWLARARASALRFSTNCSASFVSGEGLIVTNHHCARESVSEVELEGEDLHESGFVAPTRNDERKVKDLYVDKLEAIRDVTTDIYSKDRTDMPPAARAADRDQRAKAMGTRLTSTAQAKDSSLVVEVVPLYNGARYAAYTFRRYKDVRLVLAPESAIGFFGGDQDNFTYPRFNLDVSFFRAYGPDGKPVEPEHFFQWSESGASEGDPVFVIGSGGSTSRLATVGQLEYLRDYELPLAIARLDERAEIMRAYIEAHPADAKAYDLQNAYFGLLNTRKSLRGQLDGLQSDWLIPRKGAAELELRRRILANDSLSQQYRSVFDEIQAVQSSKKASLGMAQAFSFFLSPTLSSRILARAMYGYVFTLVRQRGAPPSQLREIRTEGLEIESWPPELEKKLIALRLTELRDALGTSDASVRRLLGSRTPEQVAAQLVDSTALKDSTSFRVLLDKNFLASGDAAAAIIDVIAPLYFTQNQQLESFQERENGLNARLGRARFAIYGHDVAPDATFSPRISDGLVTGYEEHGSEIEPFTDFQGLFERALENDGKPEWALPNRWHNIPDGFAYGTKLNLVSTNDITGGNSGSALVNQDLEFVGLIFDSNLQGLPSEFLYTDIQARSVSVDARGIIAALRDIYDAPWLANELASGRLGPAGASAPSRD